MLALIKKELKSLFCSPISLAVISVLNLIPVISLAVFLNISQIESGQTQRVYAGFENIVSLMVLVFAIAIPALVIISVCKEKKDGTDELISTMPLPSGALVYSKLIGFATFFALPLLIMAIFPILLKGMGEINLLHACSGLAMLFVLEIFIISFSIMVAEKSEKLVRSMLISYSVIAVSFVLGVLSGTVRLLPLGTGFDKIFGGILLELSIFKKADTAIYELLDWTAFAFFIIGAIVFIVIAVTETKKKIATALVSVALVAAVGVLPMLLPYSVRQIDINKEKLYTPESSTVDYLSSVDEDITLYLINPYTSDNELYNVIVRTVEASKNIKLVIVNFDEEKELLSKYGLQNEAFDTLKYSMIVQSEKRWIFLNAQDYSSYYNKQMGYLTITEYMYRKEYCYNLLSELYASYNSNSSNTNTQQALQRVATLYNSLEYETLLCLELENALVDAVAYVTADMIPTVYFLTGHGEEGTSANPFDFKANNTLPQNADTVVINSPSEDYSEGEIDALIKYVDGGGKIYILTDVENYSMPNLNRLLTYYGLAIESEVISVNDKSAIQVAVNQSHEAFADMSASKVTVKNVSKISHAVDGKYTYTPMLSYKVTEGEGEEAKTLEYPVAISVSEGKETKIALFTGATTFNTENADISDEELDRVAPCVTYTMYWLFDEFESGVERITPKISEKFPYSADDGQISKIVIAFVSAIIVLVVSLSAYMLSRSLRSKKSMKKED